MPLMFGVSYVDHWFAQLRFLQRQSLPALMQCLVQHLMQLQAPVGRYAPQIIQ